MSRNFEARLARLEARAGSRRKVFVWEDGTGSAEREIARFLAAGASNDVEFVIASWMPGENSK
jgi:hypothetical protein